jgi:hypothetical protein
VLALTRSSSQSWVQLMAIPSRLLMLLVVLALQVAVGCSQQPALQQQQSRAEALLQRWGAKCSRLLQLIAGMWQCSATLLLARMQLRLLSPMVVRASRLLPGAATALAAVVQMSLLLLLLLFLG